MRKIVVVAVMSIGLVIGLTTIAQASQTVKATASLSFSPATAHVSKNETVVWKNTAGFQHSVTATGGGWSKNSVIAPGGHTSFTFHSNGTYRYKCRFHAGMTGKIIVG